MSNRESWMPFLLSLKKELEMSPRLLELCVKKPIVPQVTPHKLAALPDLLQIHEIVESNPGVVWFECD